VKKALFGLLALLRARASSIFTSPTAPARAAPALEVIEPRLLYSADAAPLAFATQTDSQPVVLQQGVTQAPLNTQSRPTVEIVVIDSRVADIASFLNDIVEQQAAGRAIVLVEVNANDDGLLLVSNALQAAKEGGQEVSALHLVSHGRDGEFDLGNQTINQASLRANPAAFARWADAFSTEGDLLIYGCNFAQSSKGQDLANALAALTGADVAANPQATGAIALGGDWVLDFATGTIESKDIASQAFQASWQQLLANRFVDVTPVQVNTGTGAAFTGYASSVSASSGGHAVGVAANGDYVIVWENSSLDVKFRRFNADGTAKDGAERALNKTGSISQSQPSIAVAKTGEFVITWTDTSLSGIVIRAERYDAGGAFLGAITVSSSGLPTRSSVAFDENTKDFAIVWEAGVSNREIYARAYSWSGTALSATPIKVNTSTGADEYRPAVAVWGGKAMVVWESEDSDNGGIKYRSFTLNGISMDSEIQVNLDEVDNQSAPDIAVAQNSGNFVVT
jgi:Domain of unknown function (DUF4347)